jgi:hypothetical protein
MIKKLLNPIANFDEKVLLGVGIIFVAINVGLGELIGFRMSSVLKFFPSAFTIGEKAIATIKVFVLTIGIFYILAFVINKRTRVVDIINTFLIGVIPHLLITPISYLPYFKSTLLTISENPYAIDDLLLVRIMVLSIVSIPFVIWSIILFYNGFKTATNMKKWYHIVLFALALFIIPALIQIYLVK